MNLVEGRAVLRRCCSPAQGLALVALAVISLVGASCGSIFDRDKAGPPADVLELQVVDVASPFLAPRRGYAAVHADGRAFVFGGEQLVSEEAGVTSLGPLTDGAVLDGTEWTALPEMPLPRPYGSTATDGDVIAVGVPANTEDRTPGTSVGELLLLDIAELRWSTHEFRGEVGPVVEADSMVVVGVVNDGQLELHRLEGGEFVVAAEVSLAGSSDGYQLAASGERLCVLEEMPWTLRCGLLPADASAPAIDVDFWQIDFSDVVQLKLDTGTISEVLLASQGDALRLIYYDRGDQEQPVKSASLPAGLLRLDDGAAGWGHLIGGGIQFGSTHEGDLVLTSGLINGLQIFTEDGTYELHDSAPFNNSNQWIAAVPAGGRTLVVGWELSSSNRQFDAVSYVLEG